MYLCNVVLYGHTNIAILIQTKKTMKPKFDYDPATLTPEQLSKIAAVKDAHDKTIKQLQEDEDRRAEHYYDCLDEYSYGGPCSVANGLAMRRADKVLEDRIEEIVRGGFLIRERRVNILRDIESGNIVATGTHEGTYGRYFRTEDGKFVGCAKKVDTYSKKGYIPFVQTITEKIVRDGYWRNGDPRYKAVEVVSTTEEVSTEIVY